MDLSQSSLCLVFKISCIKNLLNNLNKIKIYIVIIIEVFLKCINIIFDLSQTLFQSHTSSNSTSFTLELGPLLK